jgi:hypothetical protein
MCAGRSLASFVPLGFRGFFVVVARRDVWRLPFFFVLADAADSGNESFIFSVVFVFFGTGVRWLNDFNSFIVHRLVRKCFLALPMRSHKLREI